ncbi:MAG: surface lipoprotein assembly modifier [Lonepinella koalarum]|nr:surface lipoprotein assembly modifier [Lonepinella koalarum]
MFKKATFCFASFTILTSQAQNLPERLEQRIDNQRFQQLEQPKIQRSPQIVETNTLNTDIQFTAEQFRQRPDLIIRAMPPALIQQNSSLIKFLLPFYQQIPENLQDPMWLKWAEAIIQKSDKNYRTSIKLYRELIADNPNITSIRLQLAIALFENKEWVAAEDQFYKLRSEKLPTEILQIIHNYLIAIKRSNPWEFNLGLTYLHDPNINNAPSSSTKWGNWSAPEKESGRGLGMNIDISKKWSWHNQFFHQIRLNGHGKYYWDNKKYNEYSGRLITDFGWENAEQAFTLSPFIHQVWYAGGNIKSQSVKRFFHEVGIQVQWKHWLSTQWQLTPSYEYSKQYYRTRKHLDGHQHLLSTTLVYLENAQRYWFISPNFLSSHTQYLDDSFTRIGFSVGTGQEWENGLSTRLSVHYAYKRYKGPMPIFQITQKNHEYGITTSLWHRSIHFMGITPKLTWQYSKVKSQYIFNNYDKHRVFFELGKTF